MENLYTQFSQALQDVGIPPISLTTCYQLMAIVNECAIEEFVFNEKLHEDVMYAQTRLKLSGGETPCAEDVEHIKRYINEMKNAETYQSEDDYVFDRVKYPKWAIDLMKDRYNVDLPKSKIG